MDIATNTTQMIDIHCHILPGVDDGAKDELMALAMLEKAIQDGVTHVILTPHLYKYSETRIEKHRAMFKQFVQTVEQKGLPIKLFLGKEVYFKEPMLDHVNHLSFEGSPYVLVEFSTSHPQSIDETVFNLKVSKLKPIVAHVERYPYLKKEDYFQIRETGALLQVNASAITGLEGIFKRRLIKFLLKNHLVDVVASDAHNMSNRKPNLKNAYKRVSKKYGKAYADLIFLENPMKIIQSITQ